MHAAILWRNTQQLMRLWSRLTSVGWSVRATFCNEYVDAYISGVWKSATPQLTAQH
ncbi:hypothetical protein PTU52_000497 [Salmonella enterica]|nr:hypothetical protein [Salmonella enterica]